MNKVKTFFIAFITLIALVGLSSELFGQIAKETLEKRKIEKAIELGSGDFYINDNTGVGVAASANQILRISGINGKGLGLDLAGSGDYVIQESSTTDTVQFGSNLYHNISSGFLGLGIIPTKTFHLKAASGATTFKLDAPTSQNALLEFSDNGSAKWELYKDSSNDLSFYNYGTSNIPLRMIYSSGDLIINSGDVAVGKSSASYKFDVEGASPSTAIAHFRATSPGYTGTVITSVANLARGTTYNLFTGGNNTATDIVIQGNGDIQNRNNSYTGLSDVRLKTNIKDAPSYISRLSKVKVRTFNWKDDNKADVGMIAQELEKVFPEFVKTGNDDFKTKAIIYSKFTPILIKYVQEQQKIIELQKAWICKQQDYPTALCGGE